MWTYMPMEMKEFFLFYFKFNLITGELPSYIIIFVYSIQFTQETIILQLVKFKKNGLYIDI